MIINKLSVEQAIWACQLNGIVPASTLYYHIKRARAKGTNRTQKLIAGIEDVVDLDGGCTTTATAGDTNISPIPVSTTLLSSSSDRSSSAGMTTTVSPVKSKKPQRSSRQASFHCLIAMTIKKEYDSRYKAAFKEATVLVAQPNNMEPVKQICDRLNVKFKLDKKRLSRSTVYRAAKDGLTGVSPKKRGPAPKIPEELLAIVATHAEVCQLGDGELEKYTASAGDANSLTEKDWGDIIRWILPEAKVDFLLKDLKKQDQMLAKLATLPNDWATYIPSRAVIATGTMAPTDI